MYHDEQFHEAIVDVARCCGLDDEDVLVSYGLAHSDAGFLVGVVQAHSLRNLDAQPACAPWSESLSSSHLLHSGSMAWRWSRNRSDTDLFATSWASRGWEFPLNNLISLDIVDMVEDLKGELLGWAGIVWPSLAWGGLVRQCTRWFGWSVGAVR